MIILYLSSFFIALICALLFVDNSQRRAPTFAACLKIPGPKLWPIIGNFTTVAMMTSGKKNIIQNKKKDRD